MRLGRRRASSDIPTTSTADVAFLLIAYFMLTTTFTATRGLDFQLPEEQEGPRLIEPVESVLVKVQPTGTLQVDGRSMPLGGLLPYLAPKLARSPTKPVIVVTDPAAPYGAMVAVLDELRLGKERLGLAEEIVIAIPTGAERLELQI